MKSKGSESIEWVLSRVLGTVVEIVIPYVVKAVHEFHFVFDFRYLPMLLRRTQVINAIPGKRG